jgi:beta-lactamase regulating signal transducer with metallopeptidase domain
MNTPFPQSLQTPAIFAVEIAAVALVLWGVQRANSSSVYRRAWCHAAVLAVLAIAVAELFGAGQFLIAWMQRGKAEASRTEALAAVRAAQIPPSESTAGALDKMPESVSTPAWLSHGVGLEKPSRKGWQIALLLPWVWLAGTFVVGVRVCLGRLLFLMCGWQREQTADCTLLELLAGLSARLNMSRGVRLIKSTKLKGPVAFGLFMPAIALPRDFSTRFDKAQQEAMLAHELAHLASHDPFWWFVTDMATTICWWHPGVWWIRRQLHLASELAADEASLVVADGPRVLANCLLELGAFLAARRPMSNPQMAGFRSHLGFRVERLLNLEGKLWRPPSAGITLMVRLLGSMSMASMILFCGAWGTPSAITGDQSMKTTRTTWKTLWTSLAVVTSLSTADAEPQGSANTQQATAAEANPSRQQSRGNNAAAGTDDDFRRRDPFEVGSRGPSDSIHGAELEAKLRALKLSEVRFEGLPLTEVLRFLSEQSLAGDPDKKGVNFLMNPNVPAGSIPMVDPATGLPLGRVEGLDLSTVTITFNLPLRNVTMSDVLDAIVKVADKPIAYAYEDYAVVFSFRPEARFPADMSGREQAKTALEARTFSVDTNTFAAGLESAFGIKVEGNKGEKQNAQKIQTALRELLSNLGIQLVGNKSVFYNQLTGVVMVRATSEELELVRAAIETLGGAEIVRAEVVTPGTRGARR